MKLSLLARACCSSMSPVSLRKYSQNQVSQHRRPMISSQIKPQIPLFLRPPIYSLTFSDLQKWQNWAKTLASSVGSSFQDFDHGPDSTLLRRELNWLMEDAIEDYSTTSRPGGCESRQKVKVRVDLEELYGLWKQRIEERRPFQYLVGCEHWRDLVLSVQEGVLIPRPETEMIVDLVCELVVENDWFKQGLWADLGTGSGALAIAIGRVLGDYGRVIATDLSPVSAMVASYNVQRYELQDKVVIKQGSWFEPLKNVEGQLVGLVSNPPYIPSDHICGLQAEVSKHEPRLALDGGLNGLDDLVHLCYRASSMLLCVGSLSSATTITNGEEQCQFLVNYMKSDLGGNFCYVKIVSDFAGIPRFVTDSPRAENHNTVKDGALKTIDHFLTLL
ncbi:hypothetical protein RJ641_000726 [Dillenia turbinata]|uniref:Methyltransferase small domain-containing protein n=1 Tax=Dillenia turbinata TaxID=194707 RepID=A0AAN8ZUF7_9MAGN